MKVAGNGPFFERHQDINDLFVHILREIYYADSQIVKGLPKMIDKAMETRNQIVRWKTFSNCTASI